MKKNKFPNPWNVRPLKDEELDSIVSRRNIVKKPQPLKKPKKEKHTWCVVIRRRVLDYYYVEASNEDEALDIVERRLVEPDESEYEYDGVADIRLYC